MNKLDFSFHFGYGSILPTILFFFGITINYLILINETDKALILMLFSLILYILNNFFKYLINYESEFNNYLEQFAIYFTFGISTIVYGIKIYNGEGLFLGIVIFYSYSLLLNLARDSLLELKNTMGWPICLNGLFFPLTYYIYNFFLGPQGVSVFLFYYIVIGYFSLTKINFLGSGKNVIKLVKDKNDYEKAEIIYEDMLKTDFKEKNLVKEVNDIFNGKRLL